MQIFRQRCAKTKQQPFLDTYIKIIIGKNKVIVFFLIILKYYFYI